MRSSQGSGRSTTPPYNCDGLGIIPIDVIMDENTKDCDAIWTWTLENSNCIFLNVDGDLLKFGFDANASSRPDNGNVYYLGQSQSGTVPRRQWTLNLEDGKLEGRSMDNNPVIEVVIFAGSGRDESINSSQSSAIQGFNVIYQAVPRGQVSGTRRTH
jgi:hypothetical protein